MWCRSTKGRRAAVRRKKARTVFGSRAHFWRGSRIMEAQNQGAGWYSGVEVIDAAPKALRVDINQGWED